MTFSTISVGNMAQYGDIGKWVTAACRERNGVYIG